MIMEEVFPMCLSYNLHPSEGLYCVKFIERKIRYVDARHKKCLPSLNYTVKVESD